MFNRRGQAQPSARGAAWGALGAEEHICGQKSARACDPADRAHKARVLPGDGGDAR